jgi:sarcosine oxidase
MVYDVIVIGCGGVGSAALYDLAARGARVLGIDQFPPGHDRGSSHGQTRVIRQAYFEHPDYVPLLKRAYELWSELEHRQSQRLYHECGVLEIGPPDGEVIPGVLRSARAHDLVVEELTPLDVQQRFPGFQVPEGFAAVLEKHGGFLRVEDCVLAHVQQAERQGAELSVAETVTGWRTTSDGVMVETAGQRYQARSLVVTAGAWAAGLLADVDVELKVLRKHLHWYGNRDPRYREQDGCPVFFYELPEGLFYGFPQIDDLGVKVAEHSGGEVVTDPSRLDRAMDPEEALRSERFMEAHLPGVQGPRTRHETCMYTMSPDGHFLVDRHPRWPNVCFAAGLSGHGFKFASVLGELLADLALQQAPQVPYEFLRIGRLAPG